MYTCYFHYHELILIVLVHRGLTDELLLLQIFSGVVGQTRDLHLSRNTLYLLTVVGQTRDLHLSRNTLYLLNVVGQTRDLHLSRNTLYLLNPRLCFFIVLKRDLFVYRDDSLSS